MYTFVVGMLNGMDLYLMSKCLAVDVPWMETFLSCQSVVSFAPFHTSCGWRTIPWYPVVQVNPSTCRLVGPFHTWRQSPWLVVSVPVMLDAILMFLMTAFAWGAVMFIPSVSVPVLEWNMTPSRWIVPVWSLK